MKTAMKTVFLDTNVFLDMLLKRTNDYEYCEEIFTLADRGSLQTITSASCLLTVIYFLGKANLTKESISEIITELLKVTSLISTDEKTFSVSMKSEFSDLEDAVQYYTALHAGNINYFITSNVKDYKKGLPQLPVLSPEQFIALYTKGTASK